MKYISLFLSGLICGLVFTCNGERTKIIRKLDTIHHEPEIITLEKVKTHIEYIRDTIISTPPFIASIDTIIKHDTVYADFSFPEKEMNIAIKQATDTVLYDKEIIINPSKEEWWEDPIIATGGVILGYIIAGAAKE